MQIQNKPIDFNGLIIISILLHVKNLIEILQNQKFFHVNNFEKHVLVTSLLNNTKKSLNSEKCAFALMSNKSLKNSYATTGL